MFILSDTNHLKICALTDYKDYHIEQAINSDDLLIFSYPVMGLNYNLINYECYISNGSNEYVIKEINIQDEDWAEIVCKINLENLKGKTIASFETVGQMAEATANLALASTGWVVGFCDVSKLRTVRKVQCSVYDVMNEIAKSFMCEITYNAVNKRVDIHLKQGADRGAYFAEQLNLKQLQVQGNTNDYITRLIPIGADNLAIDSGYVSNYQYSTKILTGYWIDNRYTDAVALKEDAIERLAYLSKPTRAYGANIIDLSSLSDWGILEFGLGDMITLLGESKNIRELQRIVKLKRYPEDPEKSTLEIANKIKNLADIILKVSNSSDVVDKVTDTTGAVVASGVVGELTQAHIGMANVDTLNAVIANIGVLIATKIEVTDLSAIYASIDNLVANKANVTDLTASTARIATLEATSITADQLAVVSAQITNLMVDSAHIVEGTIVSADIGNLQVKTGNLDNASITTAKIALLAVETAQIGNLAVSTIKIGDAQITDAKIDRLSVDKLVVVTADIGTAQITNAKIDRASANKLVVVSADIQDANITTVKIGDAQITNAKIDRITGKKLVVVSADIADANITTVKIGDAQITNAKIDRITAGKLVVITADIADANITTVKIGTAQITDAKIDRVSAGKLVVVTADIADANITTVKIGTAQITDAKIDRVSANKLVVLTADIKDGNITTVKIGDAQITNAKIDLLSANKLVVQTANIELLAVTTALIANGAVDSLQIKDASITDLKVVAVNAGKINAGTVNTNLVTLSGLNGKLRIVNNRLQVFDAQAIPIERVSIGDVNGDGSLYGFRVRGADGLTILYDENGVNSEGITDGAITNDKISPDADVDGTKLKDNSIMGDKLIIDSITARELGVDSVTASSILALTITTGHLATDAIEARNIKAGEVTAVKMNVKGLTVTNADDVVTLAITTDGSFEMAGNARSYNYSAGVDGWQLLSDGNAELNEVIVRGKVVLPNAGITNAPTGANPIRFWAGSDEDHNSTAPFQVFQNGSIKASLGTFDGTFTGDLKIGNIHIADDNINPALIEIKTNSDALLKVSISENETLFNVPVNVGTALVVDPVGNTAKAGARVEINEIGDPNTNVVFPNVSTNANQIEFNNNKFNMKGAGETFIFNSKGSNTVDYIFAKEGIADDVNVKFDGDIEVTNKLTIGNSYIQKRADGWDLMFM